MNKTTEALKQSLSYFKALKLADSAAGVIDFQVQHLVNLCEKALAEPVKHSEHYWLHEINNARADGYERGYAAGKSEPVKQEPVAWHEPNAYGNVTTHKKWAEENGWLPLYTKE